MFPIINSKKFPDEKIISLLKKTLIEPVPQNKIRSLCDIFNMLNTTNENESVDLCSTIFINYLFIVLLYIFLVG